MLCLHGRVNMTPTSGEFLTLIIGDSFGLYRCFPYTESLITCALVGWCGNRKRKEEELWKPKNIIATPKLFLLVFKGLHIDICFSATTYITLQFASDWFLFFIFILFADDKLFYPPITNLVCLTVVIMLVPQIASRCLFSYCSLMVYMSTDLGFGWWGGNSNLATFYGGSNIIYNLSASFYKWRNSLIMDLIFVFITFISKVSK